MMIFFQIDELKQLVELFSEAQCDSLSENCIVALEKRDHSTGCILNVIGLDERKIQLKWSKEFRRAGYQDPYKYVEKAAEAISFFLSCELTDYTIIREARRYKKDNQEGGFDYWLGYREGNKRHQEERLIEVKIEISGIDIENSSNTLNRRVEEKKDQILKYNSPAEPLYVSVVVFSPLKAFFGQV